VYKVTMKVQEEEAMTIDYEDRNKITVVEIEYLI
jgi:hypothetical protein